MTTYLEDIQTILVKAGFYEPECVSVLPPAPAFGDTSATFCIDPLLLRFTRERGQLFIDLASKSEPMLFHQFDDVDIAMGWRSIDEVLAKREPEPVITVLQRIRANLDTLRIAFSEEQERFTRARVQKAARERGQAFTARLREH